MPLPYLNQLIRSKALMGCCALLLLGLQLSSLIHHHDEEHVHYSDSCSMCSALSTTDDAPPKQDTDFSTPYRQFAPVFNNLVANAQVTTQQRPPARAPPIS